MAGGKGTATRARVSLATIDRRLKRIERLLTALLPTLRKEEQELMKETEFIRKEEELIGREEKRIEETESELERTEAALLRQLGEQVRRKFSDIVEWKTFVWDRCTFRRGKEGLKTIDYVCTRLDGLCRFESCPMNL